MKTNCLFLLLFLSLVSCDTKQAVDGNNPWDKFSVVARKVLTPQGDSVIVCDFSLLKEAADIQLSALFSDFDVVCLSNESNALITEGGLTVSENYFGIYSSRGGEYKLFDRKGNFITNISSRGQGANEFATSIYDSYIDEAAGRIYLLPMISNKILVFDLEGNAQGQIPLPYRAPKGKMAIDSQKKEVLMMALPFSDTPSVIWRQDFDGNIIRELSAAPYVIEHTDYSNEINSGLNTSNLDFTLFHWTPTADTLYNYDESANRLRPVFTVKFPNDILQHEYIELPDFYLIRMIDGKSENYQMAIVDKNSLKGGFVRLKLDMLGNIEGASWIDFARGYYVMNNYTYLLKEQIEAALASGNALDEEVRERLDIINDNITEDSNNVILIGKLKNSVYQDNLNELNTVIHLAQPGNREKGESGSTLEEDNKLYGFKDLGQFSNTPYKEEALEYFRTNNRYKDWDANDRKEVRTKSIVEKNGTTSNVRILKSSGIDSLDQEAIRLITIMTGIDPARNLNKQPVRSDDFVISVFFPPK